jgi:uncharacterized protein YabE (DUF348 family)
MKRSLRRSTTYIGASLLAVALLIVGFLTFEHAAGAANQSGRLITIHDRGQQTVLLSDADTVKGALEDGGVTLDAQDAVEPGLDQKLVASEYQINIYRARPVTIIDGALRQRVVTPYQTTAQIVADGGITLYPEDDTILERSDDIVSDGAGLRLTIDRATPLSFDLYGTKMDIRSQGETVGDMLREKALELEATDRVSPDPSTPITAGMAVRVWREGKQTITAKESIAFPVEQIRDADREVGYKEIRTPGQNGERNVTYEIDIQGGVEVSRTEIASIVTLEAVKQVEVIGVKSKALPYTGGGTKTEWLAASNIPQESWGYADFMVQKESGWNPNAVNKSSGACGLAQALPCSKVPGNPYNPIDSLNWMNGYVNGRYGGWANAYNFWLSHHWY